jgi:hypothetical protein
VLEKAQSFNEAYSVEI